MSNNSRYRSGWVATVPDLAPERNFVNQTSEYPEIFEAVKKIIKGLDRDAKVTPATKLSTEFNPDKSTKEKGIDIDSVKFIVAINNHFDINIPITFVLDFKVTVEMLCAEIEKLQEEKKNGLNRILKPIKNTPDPDTGLLYELRGAIDETNLEKAIEQSKNATIDMISVGIKFPLVPKIEIPPFSSTTSKQQSQNETKIPLFASTISKRQRLDIDSDSDDGTYLYRQRRKFNQKLRKNKLLLTGGYSKGYIITNALQHIGSQRNYKRIVDYRTRRNEWEED